MYCNSMLQVVVHISERHFIALFKLIELLIRSLDMPVSQAIQDALNDVAEKDARLETARVELKGKEQATLEAQDSQAAAKTVVDDATTTRDESFKNFIAVVVAELQD